MKLRPILLAVAFALIGLASSAQNFDVPANVSYESKDDYAKREADVIAAAKWLESVPVGQQTEKRQLVNAFVMQWLTGSPTVTLEVNEFMMGLTDKNPMINLTFIAGYTRWVLENHHSTDKVKAVTAGVRSAIALYNLGGDVKKNKKLLTAIEKEKEGKLEEWIKENMN